MKMKKVLIPTDFSKNAWNATRYALELFENEKCEINLLNTYTPAIATSRFLGASIETGNLENSAKFTSTLGLKNLVKRIAKDFENSNHTIKTISSTNYIKRMKIRHFKTCRPTCSKNNDTIFSCCSENTESKEPGKDNLFIENNQGGTHGNCG